MPLKTKTAGLKVKYSYLDTQFKDVEDVIADIRKLLKSGDFTLGKPVAEFEKLFAEYAGVKHAIGTANGTDALFLLLKAAGIGPGDEVITPPNSFIATTGAIIMTGAKPVFVDAGGDYNINPALIEKAVTLKTKAILPVHLTGNPADMLSIMAIAKKRNLIVMEDAAQAVGAKINGAHVGNWSLGAGFSLHPLKNINVWGDGGLVVTNNDDIASKIRLLRNHGLKTRDEVSIFGVNSRLDSLQAIVAMHMLKQVEQITQTRIANAKIYDEAFASLEKWIKIPPRRPSTRQVYHTYVIMVSQRKALMEHLAQRGVEVKIHYPIPIHLQEAANYLGYKAGDFPVTEKQAETILTLPVHQDLTRRQIDYVIRSIADFYVKKCNYSGRHSRESGNPGLDPRLRGGDEQRGT
ncbi:MAG: DegT/DnrJ/EryC1/StrS family aminotransferase [Elusimicrobia bacterium]|nr:DegT/DnrJ/EryC1/StrS family aminotransferase [Elusimicrobiota bacterium]